MEEDRYCKLPSIPVPVFIVQSIFFHCFQWSNCYFSLDRRLLFQPRSTIVISAVIDDRYFSHARWMIAISLTISDRHFGGDNYFGDQWYFHNKIWSLPADLQPGSLCVQTYELTHHVLAYMFDSFVWTRLNANYRVFQNKCSQHYCVVCAMGEFLRSSYGSTVFCVPCGYCSSGRQNTWTWLTCNMYSLEERVFFVKSYYSTQKNLKEVLRLYGKQFNVPRHKRPSKV